MPPGTWALAGVFLAVLAGPARPAVVGQTTGPTYPPLALPSMAGRDLFEFYCASCHGRDGKGGGPVVPALRTPPPDLTTLTGRNGGMFPLERIRDFVTGEGDRLPDAHGSKEMPVWGPIFHALDPADTTNRVRIGNIVTYIESIQAK